VSIRSRRGLKKEPGKALLLAVVPVVLMLGYLLLDAWLRGQR
jgi:hypothetical protein